MLPLCAGIEIGVINDEVKDEGGDLILETLFPFKVCCEIVEMVLSSETKEELRESCIFALVIELVSDIEYADGYLCLRLAPFPKIKHR